MVSLKLSATLKDVDGNPLANKSIDFYYSFDGETFTKFDTQTTNEYGVAETITSTTQDTYYKARFEGDELYEASEDIKLYIYTSIPDAEVILFDNNRVFHGHTDANGKIMFNNVPAGTYTLVIVKDGYRHYKGTLEITSDLEITISLQQI